MTKKIVNLRRAASTKHSLTPYPACSRQAEGATTRLNNIFSSRGTCYGNTSFSPMLRPRCQLELTENCVGMVPDTTLQRDILKRLT